MRYTNGQAAVANWAQRMQGEEVKEVRASNVFADGDSLYSYGYHFELARALRDRRGKVTGYLLNGERYSATTDKHQAWTRDTLRRMGCKTVIIPYAALRQANVDADSIRVIDASQDTNETKRHRSYTFPEGACWRKEEVWESQPPTEQDYADALEQAIKDAKRTWEVRVKMHAEKPDIFQDPGDFEPPARDDIRVHSKRVLVGHEEKLFTSARSWREISITYTEDGPLYDWITFEHRLGESLIRAKVFYWDRESRRRERWAYFLSGFDHQESTPLYFFCELPRGVKPKTVAEAYQALKPDPVLMAEQMGRRVSRQGDIFAIPTRLDTKALKARGARIERRKTPKERWNAQNLPYILNTNHTATEVAYLPDGVTMARGLLYHDPEDREQDHARRKMGDGRAWHIVIKNTVPTAGRR